MSDKKIEKLKAGLGELTDLTQLAYVNQLEQAVRVLRHQNEQLSKEILDRQVVAQEKAATLLAGVLEQRPKVLLLKDEEVRHLVPLDKVICVVTGTASDVPAAEIYVGDDEPISLAGQDAIDAVRLYSKHVEVVSSDGDVALWPALDADEGAS